MQFGSQSNRAPEPRAASPSCPAAPPTAATCGLLSPNPPQQKFLRHAAVQHRIDQQHVPALQLAALCRPRSSRRSKKTSRRALPAMLHVAHIFAHEMQSHRDINLRESGPRQIQIRGPSLQPRPTAGRGTRAKSPVPVRELGCAIRAAEYGGAARLGHDAGSSADQDCSPGLLPRPQIQRTTGKPRTHANSPPLVSTGQLSFSQRLTDFSFRSRASLWRF